MYMSIVYALVNVKKKIQHYVQEKYNVLKILQMYGKPLHIMKLRMYYKDLIILSIWIEGIFFFW